MEDTPANWPADWRHQARTMLGLTPFMASIGAEILEMGAGAARARLPYGPKLVGDPDSGVVHGGAVTALLDQMGGAAVMAALDHPIPIVTLDLRIDYMKPATAGVDIMAEARCLKVTHEIAFVRGSAYQTDAADPVAICTATFMLMRGAQALRAPAKG
ncbi:MAG: PaaI family thioesterase [Alphaproteobacteria bacterium]|nr:PaaI family thioesterase [Alphaproteobacteria bacterium]MDE2013228.1 PaaI family thioesterase [Alphaproteobacteria bacterium]